MYYHHRDTNKTQWERPTAKASALSGEEPAIEVAASTLLYEQPPVTSRDDAISTQPPTLATARAPTLPIAKQAASSRATATESTSGSDKSWRAVLDPTTRRYYYYNRATRQSAWSLPPGVVALGDPAVYMPSVRAHSKAVPSSAGMAPGVDGTQPAGYEAFGIQASPPVAAAPRAAQLDSSADAAPRPVAVTASSSEAFDCVDALDALGVDGFPGDTTGPRPRSSFSDALDTLDPDVI